MIGNLPVEIQVKIISLSTSSSLKFVNSHFYVLYNDLYYDKIIETFGKSIVEVLIKVLPWLKSYIKSLDVIRYVGRNIIASSLKLDGLTEDNYSQNPLNSIHVKDSWKYIYSLLRNKRLFAEYSDYKIDEPTNYIFNHFVEINRTYLLSYSKTLWLAPGDYNLNIGLVIKHGNGLGTTKFEISYHQNGIEGAEGTDVHQAFYAPTNINEILPKKQFCFLKLGEFTIPKNLTSTSHNKLTKVTLIMEEIGLYLKSGFRIFFIDVSQHSTLYNDFDLLYYTVKEIDYRFFINIPLKNFYKALNYVQNGGKTEIEIEEDIGENGYESAVQNYGLGQPNEIDDFENEFSIPTDGGEDLITSDLMKYASFYFLNEIGKRYFKFNTVYQRRQFVNRFGDYELDWIDDDVNNNSAKAKICTYDPEGLKWKIPILGEL